MIDNDTNKKYTSNTISQQVPNTWQILQNKQYSYYVNNNYFILSICVWKSKTMFCIKNMSKVKMSKSHIAGYK